MFQAFVLLIINRNFSVVTILIIQCNVYKEMVVRENSRWHVIGIDGPFSYMTPRKKPLVHVVAVKYKQTSFI